MSGAEHAPASLPSGVDLLEQAIGYLLGTLRHATVHTLPRPSPCWGWDVRVLLTHLLDSFTALEEAALTGCVSSAAGPPPAEDVLCEPVMAVRNRAVAVLDAWAACDDVVTIAGVPLPAGVVASTGAVEIAVHGWDVAQSCGHPETIPPSLGRGLLGLAPALISTADRPARFAPPNRTSVFASPGDRLVAYLGRRP
jgi:uncharacterized protein (TIGR03086 family)